jgi:hypothetical protein
VDSAALAAQPQISPLLKQCGILPARVIEVLRADHEGESRAVVALWDGLTPANRNLVGLEALAVAAKLTPRRLWELYAGATMMQSRESVGVMIADALPSIIRVTIKQAKTAKGFTSREHILKSARVLPVPKGSTTNINVGGQQPELEGGEQEQGGMLEGADDFLMRASRAMAKSLPAPKIDILPPESSEDDDADEESNS